MTLPVVKHSYLVLDAKDLPQVIKEAFLIAKTGRPGPVLIDIPKDVQQQMSVPNFDAKPDLPGLQLPPHASDENLLKVLELISSSKKPVIYAGGGIISADAAKELDEFSKYFNIPVANTLMGIGSVNPLEEKNLYWFGMHGLSRAIVRFSIPTCCWLSALVSATASRARFQNSRRTQRLSISTSTSPNKTRISRFSTASIAK